MADGYRENDGRARGEGRWNETRDYGSERDSDRGFFDRAADEVRSWFGDENHERSSRDHDMNREMNNDRWGSERYQGRGRERGGRDYYNESGMGGGYGSSSSYERGRGGLGGGPYGRSQGGRSGGFGGRQRESFYGSGSSSFGSDYGGARGWSPTSGYGPQGGREQSRYSQGSTPGSNQDDHYRSWRDRQMQSLDKDYEDYCREREQQFHQDFDQWRNSRQNSGSAESGRSGANARDMSSRSTGGSDSSTSGRSSRSGSATSASSGSETGSRERGETSSSSSGSNRSSKSRSS